MATREQITLFDMFRTAPVRSSLFTLLPLLLAVMQLANSLVNGVSFLVSVPFALVTLGFAWMVTQFSLARHRRRRQERGL